MQPQIRIRIAKGKPLQYEVFHVQGSGCKSLTQALDQLGEAQTTLKPEFYQESIVTVTDEMTVSGGGSYGI